MRLVDADKIYPDVMTKREALAISQGQLAYAPTVEAITKAEYEARLKADMVATLEKLKSEIILQVIDEPTENGTIAEMASFNSGIVGSYDIIQQKIKELEGKTNGKEN